MIQDLGFGIPNNEFQILNSKLIFQYDTRRKATRNNQRIRDV